MAIDRAMFDALDKIGVHLDDINSLRLLDPDVAGPTNELKNELRQFVQKIQKFQQIVTQFKEVADNMAAEVEKEKMKAIASRNHLNSVAKQREAQQQQLRALIAERRAELERLRIRHSFLLKVQQDQCDILEQLALQY